MSLPARPRKQKAPTLRAEVWEPYKARIIELHITQGLPLTVVKERLQKESGFNAEIRQYRTRISQWNKDKNIKPREMKAIVRKRQQRRLVEGRKAELVFRVRGKEVDTHKIDRWMKRHGISESQLDVPSPTASTPSAVSCRTISDHGSPVPRTPSPGFSMLSQRGFVSPLQSPRVSLSDLSTTTTSLIQPQSSHTLQSSILSSGSPASAHRAFLHSAGDDQIHDDFVVNPRHYRRTQTGDEPQSSQERFILDGQTTYLHGSNSLGIRQSICSSCQTPLPQLNKTKCLRCSLLQALGPLNILDNGQLDPFACFPIKVDSRVSELLYYYIFEMAPKIMILNIDNRHSYKSILAQWFPMAMSNVSFMYSLLYMIAVHQHLCSTLPISTVLYYRAQAIAAIDSAISDPNPKVRISDATIGAVFQSLWGEEAMVCFLDGREEEYFHRRAMHLGGLLKMVHLRGGLESLASNRFLQASLLCYSTVHAMAGFSKPDLSLHHTNTSYCPSQLKGLRPVGSNYLLYYCKALRIKETLIELVDMALILIDDLNVWFSDQDSGKIDPLELQNFCLHLQCQSLNWYHDQDTFTSPLERSICLVLIMYPYLVMVSLRDNPAMHHLYDSQSSSLRKVLSAISHRERTLHSDLMLWIFAIGALSAKGSYDSDWFEYQTSLACTEFGIDSPETLLRRLHLCGWVGFALDKPIRDLWDRMVSLRQRIASSFEKGHLSILEPFDDFIVADLL